MRVRGAGEGAGANFVALNHLVLLDLLHCEQFIAPFQTDEENL